MNTPTTKLREVEALGGRRQGSRAARGGSNPGRLVSGKDTRFKVRKALETEAGGGIPLSEAAFVVF